jgi:RNA polymerase sigma-70 factor (ECF subfamily)
VKLALAELPERQQTAIVLVHYEGFSGSEAANLLDISVEAVESLLARARRSLRMALKPDAAELLGER